METAIILPMFRAVHALLLAGERYDFTAKDAKNAKIKFVTDENQIRTEEETDLTTDFSDCADGEERLTQRREARKGKHLLLAFARTFEFPIREIRAIRGLCLGSRIDVRLISIGREASCVESLRSLRP